MTALVLAVLVVGAPVHAQVPGEARQGRAVAPASQVAAAAGADAGGGAQDTLRLRELLDAAVRNDARARQLVLQLEAHRLRRASLRAERLPQLQVRGEATQQSDVPELPIVLPGGEAPTSPKSRFQLSLGADQLIYDGGLLSGRGAVEDARHAELEAELHATLYPLRIEANEAYFAALLLQVRAEEVRLLLLDLDARLAQTRSELAVGAALPGDTAAVQAERLRALQQLDEIEANRAAALSVLSALSGRDLESASVLVLPDLSAAVAAVEAAGGPAGLRERPEFARLARLRERLAREADVVAARGRPQIQAFGQAGVGRPGPFQIFSDELNEYWLLGLRVHWQPWTWGSRARDRALLSVQQQVAATEESALADRLARDVAGEAEDVQRLQRALETDEQIIALREQVERQTRRQYEERAVTATQYLVARTDVFEARVAWQRHRVELERARARYLATLGVQPE